jgi:hypothetical protein
MASKQVFYRSEARERLLRGVSARADAVRVTLEATLTEVPEKKEESVPQGLESM